jgi:endonuclease-3
VRDLSDRLTAIDARLSEMRGRPQWHSHGEPLDELIATVLSQHTSDTNTARAFSNLRERFPTWREVTDAPTAEVADAIRSGGLAKIKAPRIQSILRSIEADLGVVSLQPLREKTLEDARRWLIQLPGVGPKTAACVLLFSLGLPAMPVDTHVHRVSRRLGLINATLDANAAHVALASLIGPDRDAFYALHMILMQDGRTPCKARAPKCGACILAELCPSAAV